MQNLGIYGNSEKIAEKIQERPGAGIWTTNRRGGEREGTGRELGGNSAGTWRNSRGGGGNWAGTHGRWRELGRNSAGTRRELGGNLVGTWQELGRNLFFRGPSQRFSRNFRKFPDFMDFAQQNSICFHLFWPSKSLWPVTRNCTFLQRLLKFGTMSVFAVGTKGSLVFTRTNSSRF